MFQMCPACFSSGSRTDLSPREQQVAALVAEGLTNLEIAQGLGVSSTTAKWHVSQILRKLGLRGRVQLALYAREHGFTARGGKMSRVSGS
jgi:DNA-binding NarL/FixJ family response regulator